MAKERHTKQSGHDQKSCDDVPHGATFSALLNWISFSFLSSNCPVIAQHVPVLVMKLKMRVVQLPDSPGKV